MAESYSPFSAACLPAEIRLCTAALSISCVGSALGTVALSGGEGSDLTSCSGLFALLTGEYGSRASTWISLLTTFAPLAAEARVSASSKSCFDELRARRGTKRSWTEIGRAHV